MALPRTLIDPKLIYIEPAVRDYQRGREILERFPGAEIVEVESHWKIAQLADPELAEDWLKVKRDTLVLGVKKGVAMRPNGRSARLHRALIVQWLRDGMRLLLRRTAKGLRQPDKHLCQH